MSVFVLSDLHLSSSSEKPMSKFGSRWTDHMTKIKLAWNHTVSEEDTVIIGGDISWAMHLCEARDDLLFLSGLNGKKILLRGNHDYWWSSLSSTEKFMKENGIFDISLLQNSAYVCEDLIICGSRGWYTDKDAAPQNTDYKKITERECIRFSLSLESAERLKGLHPEKEIVAITHFPPVLDSFIFRPLIDIMENAGIKRCFYGHIHSRYGMQLTSVYNGIEFTLTACDHINFTPMRIN